MCGSQLIASCHGNQRCAAGPGVGGGESSEEEKRLPMLLSKLTVRGPAVSPLKAVIEKRWPSGVVPFTSSRKTGGRRLGGLRQFLTARSFTVRTTAPLASSSSSEIG